MTPNLNEAILAFTDGQSWSIKGPFWRHCGNFQTLPLPAIDCPVVDLSSLTSQALLAEAYRKHCSPAGVKDLGAFLSFLERIGCVISYPEPMPGEIIPPVMERVENRQIAMLGFEGVSDE